MPKGVYKRKPNVKYGMTDKKHSEETKRKISIKRKGHPAPKTAFQKGHIPWIKGKHHSEKTKNKIADGIQGKNNVHWKGGRKHTTDGYIFIYKLNYPFVYKNYVAEHRLIMERWLRKYKPNHPALIEIDGIKYLRREWVVHHINGIRDDNRIENLQLFPNDYKYLTFHKKFNQLFPKIPLTALQTSFSHIC